MTDADLLTAMAHHPDLLASLHETARKAYLTTRAAPGCDWKAVDGRWQTLVFVLQASIQASQASNPNSQADKSARLTGIRAALSAIRDFEAVEAACLARVKAHPAVPTAVYVSRMHPEFGRHPLDIAAEVEKAA